MAAKLALDALSNTPDSHVVRVAPCEVVTAENLDEFARRYCEAAGLPLEQYLPASIPARGRTDP